MSKINQTIETTLDLHFPKAGLDRSMAFGKQPARPLPDGYARTCPIGQNVRGFEPSLNRLRGGQRPGLVKYNTAPVVANWIVQDLTCLVGTGYNPPGGGTVQTSQSGRVVTLIAVSQGNVYAANAADTAWVKATNNTPTNPPLNFTGLMHSSPMNQKLYFADGVHWRYYVPSTNSVEVWSATAGALPVDSAGNTPRLICTWRGRIVVSGLLKDGQNWFMSRVDTPTDFDYAPVSFDPRQAIAGNNGPLGLVGDIVTALIPWSDDMLFFGCDHEIWLLRGDPYDGGKLDNVSRSIGMAWGVAWEKDPEGNIYFFSNKTGIYVMRPGQQPQRISQQIEKLLQDIDTGVNTIRMIWDDRFQGLHVFVSVTAAPGASTHFFWERRNNAWWTDVFTNTNHNPLCCVTFDGNLPGDRVPLIGSWDGYVRSIDPTATTDDGTAISSEVWIGPITTPEMDELKWHEIQGVFGGSSDNVNYEIHLENSPENALAGIARKSGVFKASRGHTDFIGRAGHAGYVRVLYNGLLGWSMESIRLKLSRMGPTLQRRKDI